MKRIKFLYLYLLAAVLLMPLSVSASTYYSEGRAKAVPSSRGKVWVYANKDGDAYTGAGTGECYQSTKSGSQTTYTYTFSADDAIPGYTFNGWYSNEGCTNRETTDKNFTVTIRSQENINNASKTYWAKWTPNTYTVNFNKNASDATLGTTSSTVTYDAQYGAGTGGWPTPTRTNYTFVGWYTKSSGGAKIESSTTVEITSAQTLYAHWTATYYARAESYSSPAAGGGTWISCNGNYPSLPEHYKAADYSNWSLADQTSEPSCPAYYEAKQYDGYKFNGWYTAANGGGTLKNANISYTENFTVTAVTSASRTTIVRYAYFVPVTVNSIASNSNPTTSALAFTKPETKTATVVFNVSNADETADFNTPTINGAGWTLNSWSYANNQITVNVDFTASATTAQGDYTATITLTSKETGGSNKVATVAANVNLTPTLTASANTLAFGEYTLAKDTRKSKTVTLTFNDNALSFEKTDDASIDPFKATLSGDHKTLTVYFEPEEVGNWSKNLVVTVQNNQNPRISASQTILLTGSAKRNTSTINCSIAENYMVDAPNINLATAWTSTADGKITYSIESFTPSSDNNSGLVSAPKIEDNKLSLGQAGELVLKLTQPQTTNYNAVNESKTITIHKYNSVYAGVRDTSMLVDESVVSLHTLTYTKPNAEYIGENHTAVAPTFGENPSSCFYTLTHVVTTEFTTGSVDATKVIAYNAGNKTVTGMNQGVGTIALTQPETYKYSAATDTFRVTVAKHANALTCSWGDWTKAMNNSTSMGVTFSAINTNYTLSPIQITQTYGEDVAILANNKITTNSANGYATWYIYQAPSYKFNSAEADVMVTVGVPAPPTCYVVDDATEHSFSTHINDWEGHFDTPIAVTAPVDRLWFSAKKSKYGVDCFTVEYTVDNGAHWRTLVDDPGLGKDYKNYGPYSFPGLQSNERVTHIRFAAKQGATLTKWYKNIKVSRKAYLNIQDATHNNISTLSMPNNTIGNTTQAKIYVDYSTCADEIRIESNNPHFTLSKSQFTANGDNRDTQKEEIVISYTNSEVSKDTAIISVYTSYQRKVIRVTGETNKRVQTLTWQEGYNTNPITVPVGLVVDNTNAAVLASSTNPVKYASGDEKIIKIINNGYGFQVIGSGTTTITASEDGNATWLPVSEEKTIVTTDKTIQEISWQQTFPLRMKINDVIDLEAKVYLRNTTTGEKVYSAERTEYLTYSCPNNNGVITYAGGKMTIVGYGTTTITARVPGNEEYEAAASVTLTVIVHEPSSGCETPLTFYQGDAIEIFLWDFSFTDWETPQITTDAFGFDLTNGKPDKLSFQHGGAPYHIIGQDFYGGTILVQEHVNNGWVEVANSRVEPTKNAWNRMENLQLSEDADSIRFMRLPGGTGSHYIKDIQITLRQYLRTTEAAINLGDVKVGETRKDTIDLEYSDLKGDIKATRTAKDNWLTLANNGDIEIECGTHGQYSLPIVFAPKQKGEWKDTIVVYDNIADITLRIALQANVLESDKFIFEDDGEWGTESNWNTDALPAPNSDVLIVADVTIIDNVVVNSVEIGEGGSITIAPTGGLTVGAGGIIGSTDDNLILQAGTVGALKGQTGFLRISPEYTDTMPHATVELFSKAYYDPNSNDKNNTASWQYVGIPIASKDFAKTFFANSRIYSWQEASGEWINDRKTLVMTPFIGYCTSQYRNENGMLITFKGQLVNRKDQEVLKLSYTPESAEPGLNVFANSYSAPIDITKIDVKDFIIGDDDDATIHLFNTGSRIDISNQEGVELDAESVEAAGQYIPIPVGSANDMKKRFNCPTVIAPMQGFFVKTTKKGSLTLRYEDVVWRPAPANTPMRSRRKTELEEDESVSSSAMKVTLSSNGWKDRVYLLESEQYSTSFEKGIDARKMESGDFNIFVVADDKRLAVNATNSITNTHIGVRTGEEMYYTMIFTNLYGDTEWSLLDTETNEMTDIEEGFEYSFYAEPNTEIEGRFIIVERAQVPTTPTGIDGAEVDTKVQKFIKDNQLFVLKNGVLYNAQGKVVR